MRLIDADAYKEVFERNARYYEDLGNHEMAKFNRELAESIDKRPTAYDIDKVVEELEELIQGCQEIYEDSKKLNNLQMRTASRNQAIALKQAIEIVKGGGQDA